MIKALANLLAILFLLFHAHTMAQECTLRRIGRFADNPDYRPTHIQATYQGQVQFDTNLTLFTRLTNQPPAMELAEQIKVDKQNKTLRIKIKQNCGWSDGTMVTAEQMLKGIQLVFSNPDKSLTLFGNYFKNGTDIFNGKKDISELGIRLIDQNTLEFDLIIPPHLLIQVLTYPAFTPAPLHLMQKDKNAWPNKSIVRVSSGPYQAIKDSKKEIHLKRNPYICPSAKADFEYVQYIKDNNNLNWAKKLLLGQIDVAHEVKPKQAHQIMKHAPSELDITIVPHSFDRFFYLLIDSNHPVLKNKQIRKAITYAIDYKLINSIASSVKMQEQTTINYTPHYPDYNPKKHKLPFDNFPQRVKKAKQIMHELGYGPNNRLKINFFGKARPIFKSIQKALASMLQQIYIDLNLSKQTNNTDYLEAMPSVNFPISIVGWGADIADPSNFLEGLTDFYIQPYKLKKQIQDKLKASYQIYDQKQRFKKLAEIEDMIFDLYTIMPLYEETSYFLLRSGFTLLNEASMAATNINKQGCQ